MADGELAQEESLPDQAIREARRVCAAAREQLGELLDDLERWVSVDSRADELELLEHLARDIAARVGSFGFETELVPIPARGPYVHATLRGSGRGRVALLCHHDTVFGRGTASARPFTIEGDRAFGPGVADMKGGLALAAQVGHHMAEAPWAFAELELVSASDEESRPQALRTIERLKGFDAVLCFECGRADGSIVSARKGGRWLRIRANGRASHAGVAPEEGRNAAHAICHEALRLIEIDAARDGMTLQITGLEGGIGLNTVPAEAALTADLRAQSADDLEWALGQVEAFSEHPDVTLELDDLGGPPPLELTPNGLRLAEGAISIGRQLGHEFGHVLTGGVSDGSWTACTACRRWMASVRSAVSITRLRSTSSSPRCLRERESQPA